MPLRSLTSLFALLDSSSPVDLAQIRHALGGASRATAFRFLAQVPHRRSYNFNGRYYTRLAPDLFDRFGLYSVGDVHFSLDGSLLNTVSRLVQQAQDGWTLHELQDLLKVRVQSALLKGFRGGAFSRVELDGVFLYVNQDTKIQNAQILQRRLRISGNRSPGDGIKDVPLDDSVVIQVLLVLIRHPEARPGDIVRHLRGHLPPVTIDKVEAVFTRFQLGEKKRSL